MRLVELDQVQAVVVLQRVVGFGATAGWTFVMHFAIADRDVAGPDIPVVPRGRITAGRIVCLHVIEGLFGFINTVAVNSVSTRIQFLLRGVSIIWIRKDVEAVDYYALCEMKTNVI